MSRSRRLVPVLAVAVLAIAGCGSTVDGRAVGSSGAASSSTGSTAAQDGARFTDPTAVAALRRDVGTAVAAINSYDYRDVAGAKRTALRYVTGSLTADLTNTYDNVIAKNAPGLRAVQRARVNAVGVATVQGNTATLLVFGSLTITTTAAKNRTDPFGVSVIATNVGGDWKLRKVSADGGVTGTPPGTPGLAQAATAAGTAAAAVTSLRRSSFDADYDRALSLLGGSVRSEFAGRREATRRALTQGRFDLSAEARGVAVDSATGTRAVVLVALSGRRIDNGTTRAPIPQRLRLTMTSTAGRWLVTDLESVGPS